MKNYSVLVERWLLPASVPPAVFPVVESLRKRGIKVCRIGMENPKAPTHYVFVDRPFDAQELLTELRESDGLSVDQSGSGINSREYVWIGFEAGICTET